MDAAIIISAFEQAFSPLPLLLLLAGAFWGIIIGALPGLGGIIAISTVLPFTYKLPAAAVLGMLMGVFCGVVYGGSISAILMNTPGTPQAAATCFDGFPMARQGKAGEALGWATVSSVFGGLFSCAVLIFAGPALAEYSKYIGPLETLALITMAMTSIAAVSADGIFKGLLAGCIGLFLATIGVDPMSGNQRFTFDIFELSAGINLVALCVGFFAMSEVLCRAFEASGAGNSAIRYTGMRFPRLKDWTGRVGTFFKSAVIGTCIGIMPGIGADTAAFIGYAEARRSSPFKDGFGKGEPAGIIGPEAANNAVTGGALVPSLALGIPGDPLTAIMLSTLIIHGLTPGVQLMRDNPDTVVSLFILLFLANLLMLPVGMLIARAFSWIIRVPESLLMAGVTLLCVLGVYISANSVFQLRVALCFAFLGFLMRQLRVPAAPLVIGFVLSVKFEVSLRQSLILSDGNPAFFLQSPIAATLFGITFIILLMPLAARKRRAAD